MKILIVSIIFSSIIGCNKSNNEEAIIESKQYRVPIQLTINGISKSSEVLVAEDIFGCPNVLNVNSITSNTADSDFNVSIAHFKPEGFTFKGDEIPGGDASCEIIELLAGDGAGGNYISKSIDGGKVMVSGKTYTLTCNAKKLSDTTNPNAIYSITATWTRP
jgi:hypothetical protein